MFATATVAVGRRFAGCIRVTAIASSATTVRWTVSIRLVFNWKRDGRRKMWHTFLVAFVTFTFAVSQSSVRREYC